MLLKGSTLANLQHTLQLSCNMSVTAERAAVLRVQSSWGVQRAASSWANSTGPVRHAMKAPAVNHTRGALSYQHFGLHGKVLNAEHGHHAADALATENSEHVVLQAQKVP